VYKRQKAAYDKFKKPGSQEISLESFNIGNLRVYSKNDYKFAKITSANKELIDVLLSVGFIDKDIIPGQVLACDISMTPTARDPRQFYNSPYFAERNVIVKKVPDNMTQRQFLEKFRKFGEVLFCKISYNFEWCGPKEDEGNQIKGYNNDKLE